MIASETSIYESVSYNPPGFSRGYISSKLSKFPKLEGQKESNKIEFFGKIRQKFVPLFHIYELWDNEGYVLICRIVGDINEESVSRYIHEMFPLADANIFQHNIQTEIKKSGRNE